jgi:hypothetical protein
MVTGTVMLDLFTTVIIGQPPPQPPIMGETTTVSNGNPMYGAITGVAHSSGIWVTDMLVVARYGD